MDRHYLTSLLTPESIVVFAGRSDDAASQTPHARALHAALRAQRYAGTLHFLDIHTSGTLADLAQSRADLAIIALPPEDVAAALELAGRMACRSALVVSSGIGPQKAAELKRIAQREGINLLGPNCLGFQRPQLNLNASAIGPLARSGPLALVSQSGALTSSMLDWAAGNAVGFSCVVSLGRGTAVDIAQVLDFLAHDAQTQSIVVYLEGITSARRFMSALRSAAIAKPVVVLKSGRKPAGNEAAQTHSGAIVGSDDVFDAALRRAGAVRVRSFVELFSAAKCLASRYRPVGRRLAIVTNGGGPGVLAADWVSEIGLQLGRLSPESVGALRPRVPGCASLSDLIDLSEEGGPEHFKAAVETAGTDHGIDGVLAIYSPKAERRRRVGGARPGRRQAIDGQAAADLHDGRRLGRGVPQHPQRRGDPQLPHARRPPSARSATSRRSTRTSCCCSRRRLPCPRWPSPTSKRRAWSSRACSPSGARC